MSKPFTFALVLIALTAFACTVTAPQPSAVDVKGSSAVNASIETDSIKMDTTSLQAGEIKFTIANHSGKSQYVIIAPAECAAHNPGTPTPECKAKFVEQSVWSNQTWEVTVNLEPGDYVLESMVMTSGPLQLSETYFTVVAP